VTDYDRLPELMKDGIPEGGTSKTYIYTPRNEAAERLRNVLILEERDHWATVLDEALAAERNATVERIRDELMALTPREQWDATARPARRYLAVEREQVQRILDKEAAR